MFLKQYIFPETGTVTQESPCKRFYGMLKKVSKYEILCKINVSFPSPVPPALLLVDFW
jgi:hypothetical protein